MITSESWNENRYTPRDALTLHLGSHSVNWCLAKG